MGLGDAALPRFYAVRPLRCDSPFFSVPIMPAGPSQERSSAFVVLDRLDRPDAAIHPAARKAGSAKLPSTLSAVAKRISYRRAI
jgi:hypothetical protein